MYWAVELIDSDRDLHRFLWRSNKDESLKDYRMTCVTFGMSSSSLAANMSVKRNALDDALEFPQAADAVASACNVDDCLTGADSIDKAIGLHHQLLNLLANLLAKGGFLLRKWSSSDPAVLCHISPELRDTQSTHHIPSPNGYTKTLGIEWNANLDHFRLTVASLQDTDNVTKRALISDIANL